MDPKQIIKQKGTGAMNAILMHNLPPEMGGSGGKKPRKSKYQERKYIFVLDDLASELKSPSLVGFLKESRHSLSTCILSSQFYLDIKPESRAQIDYALIYGGARLDKLEIMWKDFDMTIDFEEFKELYEHCTREQPYHFLYVDVRKSTFRKDFNTELNLT